MKRRDFLKSMGGGAVSLTVSNSALAGPQAASKALDGAAGGPNIIYILADDLGYGDLGCYGQKRIKTPNLDRMAAEGVRFTDHYAGSTVCAPSRCVLMTGLHTGHALIRGNARLPLREADVTVAELMKAAGYATACIGKWGLGEAGSTGVPNKQGFDYCFGYLNQRHAHNYYPEFLWKNERKFPLEGNKLSKPDPVGAGRSVRRTRYSHDLFTAEAIAFIRRSKSKPFFLYLPYTIPHANNEAGKEGMEVPSLGGYAGRQWPAPQKGHAAMISRMDADVGRLLAVLKELGLDDNTIVMFSSDNGPHGEGGADPKFFGSSGPLRGMKRDLYEGGVRVPMIARWPGRIKPGSRAAHVSAFWDVLPTCCELAGIEAPAGIDGISFAPTLLGRPGEQAEHEFLYWEFHERGGKQAVRFGRWKGVRVNVAADRNSPIELYDLKADPGENNNVAAGHGDLVKKIAGIMVSARTDSTSWRFGRKKKRKPPDESRRASGQIGEDFEIVDESFREILRPDSALRRIAAGLRFTEGPVWIAKDNCLLFSDIPADTIYRWREGKGLEVFRRPSHNANGNTLDAAGRLITCEHGSRTVTRTAAGGKVTTLARTYKSKPLNSPNDAVVKSDGTIWFTDPDYGIKPEQRRQPVNYVFRIDPGAKEPVVVADEFARPNGLCFSPDEKLLYVADSDGRRHHVRRFAVQADNTLQGGRLFATIRPGAPDGIRVDQAGRLFATSGDGVQVFSPAGKLLGRIRTPQAGANCAFGGRDLKTLFITAREAVWAADLATAGARRPARGAKFA